MTRGLAGLATGLWRPPGAELGLPGYASDVWACHPSTAQGRLKELSGRGCCASHQVIERSGPSWVLQFWCLAGGVQMSIVCGHKVVRMRQYFCPCTDIRVVKCVVFVPWKLWELEARIPSLQMWFPMVLSTTFVCVCVCASIGRAAILACDTTRQARGSRFFLSRRAGLSA